MKLQIKARPEKLEPMGKLVRVHSRMKFPSTGDEETQIKINLSDREKKFTEKNLF